MIAELPRWELIWPMNRKLQTPEAHK